MDYRVLLTVRARRDLAAIWKHIAKEDTQVATRFTQEIGY